MNVPDYDAVKNRQPGAYRSYSCKRTTFRPAVAGDSGRPRIWPVWDLDADGRAPFAAGGAFAQHDPGCILAGV